MLQLPAAALAGCARHDDWRGCAISLALLWITLPLHLFRLPTCRSMAASPSAHLLAPLLEQGGQLGCLCDAKAAGGQSYYRLNDDKVSRSLAGGGMPGQGAAVGLPLATLAIVSGAAPARCTAANALLTRCTGAGLAAAQDGAGQGGYAGLPLCSIQVRSLGGACAPCRTNPCAMHGSMNPAAVRARPINEPWLSPTAHWLSACFPNRHPQRHE